MHKWGDGFEYFDDVENAAQDLREFCIKWGRLGGTAKEKFGTARFYANFGIRGLHNLTHPGWANYGWYPEWLIHLDLYFFPIFFKYTGVTWFFYRWQPIVYNMAYRKVLKKYPHITKEILGGADHPELLKGN